MEKIQIIEDPQPEQVAFQAAEIALNGAGPDDPRARAKIYELGSTELVDAGVSIRKASHEDLPEDQRRVALMAQMVIEFVASTAEKIKIEKGEDYRRVRIV